MLPTNTQVLSCLLNPSDVQQPQDLTRPVPRHDNVCALKLGNDEAKGGIQHSTSTKTPSPARLPTPVLHRIHQLCMPREGRWHRRRLQNIELHPEHGYDTSQRQYCRTCRRPERGRSRSRWRLGPRTRLVEQVRTKPIAFLAMGHGTTARSRIPAALTPRRDTGFWMA